MMHGQKNIKLCWNMSDEHSFLSQMKQN